MIPIILTGINDNGSRANEYAIAEARGTAGPLILNVFRMSFPGCVGGGFGAMFRSHVLRSHP
jgi:hypothetical protein